MRLAIIGGSGVYDPDILDDIRQERISTPFGEVTFQVGSFAGKEVAFLPRHGSGHSIPPHRINYRANIWALKEFGAGQVLATSAVGSLNPAMKPGHFVLLDQFIDFTKSRVTTFFDGEDGHVVHTDFTEPYCPRLRQVMLNSASEAGAIHPSGCYVCVEGPRYETPAEVQMFRMLGGDVVGMTNVPEVTLARELGLCYAVVAMVTNMGAGIAAGKLAHGEVVEIMGKNTERLRALLMATIERITSDECSHCGGKG